MKIVAHWLFVAPLLIVSSVLSHSPQKNIPSSPKVGFQKTSIPKPIVSKARIFNSTQLQPLYDNNVICITIPKCGTHLLMKCLTLFEQPGLVNHESDKEKLKPSIFAQERYKRLNRFDPPNHYKGQLHVPTVGPLPKRIIDRINHKKERLRWSHWTYTKEAASFFSHKSRGNFFLLRDPRDMIVSMAFMIKDGWEEGQHAPLENLIYDFIDGRQKNFIRWGVEVHEAYPLLWELGVVGFYKLYLPWADEKKFYTVHFESLIGSKGGGSDELQIQEITNIAQHIGLTLPPEKIKAIRDELFGNSRTFREGKISGWQKYFTPEMKAAFKRAPGANQLLIDLGYEKDTNW